MNNGTLDLVQLPLLRQTINARHRIPGNLTANVWCGMIVNVNIRLSRTSYEMLFQDEGCTVKCFKEAK